MYEELLMTEQSRRNMDYVAHLVNNNPDEFAFIMDLLHKDDEAVARRAAWVMTICVEKNPGLLFPYLEKLIDALPHFTNYGIKRQVVKVLSLHPIPYSRQGEMTDLCFSWLRLTHIPVSIKIHCMQILAYMLYDHPGLANELESLIRELISRNSAGFASKGKNILQLIDRLKSERID